MMKPAAHTQALIAIAVFALAYIILPSYLLLGILIPITWFFGSHVLYALGDLFSAAINHEWTPEQLDIRLHAIYQRIMAASLWLNEKTRHGPWL